ncbi:MAG: response regulator [Oscillospiraceae bacterium]|nr:response regulator [Oscillospiraceae bacterium]
MFNRLKEIWKELSRSILVGERYEKNMRGISLVASLIVVVNIITGCLNLKNGYYSAALTSPLFIFAGLLILYFIRVKQNRAGAVITALIAVVIIFTYEAFTVTHGFTIFWTLLLPLAFSYFADVRAGIGLSLYFLILYWVLFFTPLRESLGRHYSDIIAQRFPILYLANVILTTYIMVQYHQITLHQMDNARQLLEAKAAADRSNAAKGDFLANMSHEIRTPINAVLGMNEMILRESMQAREQSAGDASDARQKAFENIGIYAGDVKSAGTNLLAIINDILDYSKIEANRMEIVEGEYKFSSVLNDVSNLVFFKAKEKGLDFLVDVDETIPDSLYGDEVRIRQIITNILGNAVKYTEEGSVHLSVRQEQASPAESDQTISLIVIVKDTGIGIREEDVSRLFTKFERVDLEHNSTVEGTGLGLAISQALVAMMGGHIGVESEYGKGSTFTVSLPQKVVSPEPLGNYRERFEKNVLETTNYRESFHAPEAHILIVDDTQMNLAVVVRLLKSTEIRIDTAPGGEEAVAMAKDTPYDLILMDQRMPNMDGTEAMHRIKTQLDGANNKTPIICLTADAIIGAKERYIAEGFTDYLAKPVDGYSLESMLMKHLPAEKIQRVQISQQTDLGGKEEETVQAHDTAGFAQLSTAGIQPETGLNYCQGDSDFYRSMLLEYAQSAREKMPDIRRRYAALEWKDYAILVHALKSTSKMIGATSLSIIAARLEASANQNQTETIQSEHPLMMNQYETVVKAIETLFGEQKPAPDLEEDILEFLPEEE